MFVLMFHASVNNILTCRFPWDFLFVSPKNSQYMLQPTTHKVLLMPYAWHTWRFPCLNNNILIVWRKCKMNLLTLSVFFFFIRTEICAKSNVQFNYFKWFKHAYSLHPMGLTVHITCAHSQSISVYELQYFASSNTQLPSVIS